MKRELTALAADVAHASEAPLANPVRISVAFLSFRHGRHAALATSRTDTGSVAHTDRAMRGAVPTTRDLANIALTCDTLGAHPVRVRIAFLADGHRSDTALTIRRTNTE